MKVAADRLKEIGVRLLEALGAEPREAELVADNLVMADLRGISTHGVMFLPLIAERIEAGLLVVPTRVEVIADEGAIAHFDGGNGLGQVAAAEAMRMSIDKARRFGIGFSLVRHTNHIGPLAYYPRMAAAEGLVGMCMCNGAPSMASWGGTEAFFGTNPFSVAAPCGRQDPIVLDMSTSVVARGKIRRALKRKEMIPPGWAFDSSGSPTEDPAEAMKGTLMPIGGPKGAGMAFFIDMICGLLSGSKYSRQVLTFHQPLGPTGVGVMTMAVDISRFMPLERFTALMEEHARSIRGSSRARGCSRIYLPGEIEAERERLGRERGVEVDAPVIQSIDRLLEKKGLALRIGEGEPKAWTVS